jgi:hypothetical protein
VTPADDGTPWHRVESEHEHVACCDGSGADNVADAALIVAAVNALPRLVARVRELEGAERRAYERAASACRESVDGLRKTAASHRAEHNQRGANYYEAAADGALAAWSAIRALAPAEGKEGGW